MLARVRNHLHTLCDMNVVVTLVWIPGHSNVYYNDLVDVSVNNSIKDAYDIPTTSELTTDWPTCKRLISKQCNSAWQTRWDSVINTAGRPKCCRKRFEF